MLFPTAAESKKLSENHTHTGDEEMTRLQVLILRTCKKGETILHIEPAASEGAVKKLRELGYQVEVKSYRNSTYTYISWSK